jgi:hypothetical protein
MRQIVIAHKAAWDVIADTLDRRGIDLIEVPNIDSGEPFWILSPRALHKTEGEK